MAVQPPGYLTVGAVLHGNVDDSAAEIHHRIQFIQQGILIVVDAGQGSDVAESPLFQNVAVGGCLNLSAGLREVWQPAPMR